VQNNIKLPGGILLDLSYGRYSDWIWRGSIRVRGNQYLDVGLRKELLDQRLQVRITGSDLLRTNSDYFYGGAYGGLEIDGVRTFDNQRFGAGATWKFGNQKVKAAKRSKGAMEEEMRRLNGGD
jgi:iron complex outermembrane recepter protein